MRSTFSFALVLVMLAIVCSPAAAGADQLTVDFESGPPLGTAVNDDYLASVFVRFFQNDPGGGFRPYRRSAPGLAHSGTVVADVGGDICFQDTGGSCELVRAGTTGRLTRTASAVTVFAGTFGTEASPETAHLTAFRADGSVAAVSPDVPVDSSGFNNQITVSSAAGDIAYFNLSTAGLGEGDLGFDDLTITYPANSLPDVAPTITNNVTTVLQGQSVDVPVGLTRLNGSTGPLQLSVTGLPAGVTAQAVPNPVPGTRQSATLRLTASAGAPQFDAPVTATLNADPQGNVNAAPAVRTAQLLLKVADPYELKLGAGASSNVALPDCAPVDVPIVVARDGTFTGTVTLRPEGVPAGVTVRVDPSGTVSAGGSVFADRTIHFSRVPGASLPATLTVRAGSPGLADRTLMFTLRRATPSATPATAIGLTPRHLLPGTQIRINGNGFCPGTSVMAGNQYAGTDAFVPDEHTLLFTVPRLATTGPVTILPPDGETPYETTGSLTVASVRNTNGFQFHNYPYGSLSIGELTDAFGANDLFIRVNPCWPWTDCTITTGILNPLAALDWAALNIVLHESGGHCFGISRASQQLVSHKVPDARFGTGSSVWSLPGPDGPSAALGSYLDGQHALQGSAEFLSAYLHRQDSIDAQLSRLHAELAAGREPIVTLKGPDFGEGHAVLAYDEQPTNDGVDILVYDNDRNFTADEDLSPDKHKTAEEASVIHIDLSQETWSFDNSGNVWSGGNDGSLFVMPQSTIPDDPSLPGLGTLGDLVDTVVFGSADGSVRTVHASHNAQLLPVLDDHAPPGGAGWWLSDHTGAPLEVTMRGVKHGHYTEAYTAAGFAGAVTQIATAAGVRDTLRGSPTGTLRFSAGMNRPLGLQLARQTAGATTATTAWTAAVQTHTFKHGEDTASLSPSGTLTYAHDGAPTAISFTLTSIRPDGGPARFDSGPVTIGARERITVVPLGAELGLIRLTIHNAHGHSSTHLLRNRAQPPARLTLSNLRLSAGQVASVRARVASLRSGAVAGIAFRLIRGGRVIARHGAGLKHVHNGSRSFRWRIPRVPRDNYHLAVDLTLATTGAEGQPSASTVRATRSTAVSVGHKT